MSKKFYVSTPIYYVNDKPHIGHAYTSVAADVIARFKHLDGFDTFFLTGTDEHGQKVQKSAAKNGIAPQKFVDKFSAIFQEMHTFLKCSNNDFIRTTETRHKHFVSQIWTKLYKKGYIYLDKYSGWYSVRDETFFQESELIDGKAPTGAEVSWVEEESYFFKLSAFQDKVLEFYEKNPKFIMPQSRANEVISFVRSGLRDLSISRTSFDWGIPVPDVQSDHSTTKEKINVKEGDSNASSKKKHVMYVWIDALFNYISASPTKWPCDLHIVGKDILRFHAIYWPALLMALEIELPKRIFAHGWWTNEGQKISKSLGNTLDPYELAEESSVDYLRFYMMREFPFGNDGNYSRDSFVQRINSELANNIGNLIQRTITISCKRIGEFVPNQNGNLNEQDQKILSAAANSIEKIRQLMENQEIQSAIGTIVDLGHLGNEYINDRAPWAQKESIEIHNTIFVLLNVIYTIGVLLQPFAPDSATKILEIFEETQNGRISFEEAFGQEKTFFVQEGSKIFKPGIIFQRLIEDQKQTAAS